MARLGRAQPFPPKLAQLLPPSGPVNAPAEVATATATAYNATCQIGTFVVPTTATVTVTANNATTSVKTTGGLASVTATGRDATATSASQLFATSVSSNGRYLLDQNGDPYFIQGNSPQTLAAKATLVEIDTFFANQAAKGINSAQIHLIVNDRLQANANASNINGDQPFSNLSTFASPNANYWAFIDDMLDLAEQYGITVWASPCEHISWGQTLRDMSDANATNYGAFIGARYKDRTNIIWSWGNDWQSDTPWVDNTGKYDKVKDAIVAAGDTHLHTVWLEYTDSISTDLVDTGGFSSWESNIDVSLAYSYTLPYYQIERGYARTSPSVKPVFFGEGNYEGEHLHPEFGEGTTTDETLRRSSWWSVTWGGCGSFFGQAGVWNTDDISSGNLNSTAATQNARVAELLTSFDNWQDLVPDTGHLLLTAGRGTHSTAENLDPLDNDYATIAKTADGSLAIGYFPTSRAITLDTSVMTAPVTGYWYDPTNGSTVVDNPPVVHPGANSTGQHDWVLVLEGPASTNAAAERAQVTATANTATASVKPNAGAGAATATSNNAAPSVKVSAGVATATVTAYNATVQTGTFTNASAGAASATATALDATCSVKTTGGLASVTATANNAAVTTNAQTSAAAGAGSATATANDATVKVATTASAASATATANQPAVDNGAGIATYFRIVRLARPAVVRLRRPRLDL